jgi:hypothetical protein
MELLFSLSWRLITYHTPVYFVFCAPMTHHFAVELFAYSILGRFCFCVQGRTRRWSCHTHVFISIEDCLLALANISAHAYLRITSPLVNPARYKRSNRNLSKAQKEKKISSGIMSGYLKTNYAWRIKTIFILSLLNALQIHSFKARFHLARGIAWTFSKLCLVDPMTSVTVLLSTFSSSFLYV